MLHELGYDVFTMPKLHMSEQRRLVEGKLKRQEMENEAKMEAQGQDPELERMKQQSKNRARERMIDKVN